MFGIINLATYLLGTLAIILLPGPNSLFCLAVAARQGKKEGYKALLGIMLGDSLLILATVFGASAVLRLYPPLFYAIKLAGGLYLAYIGLNLLKAAWQSWHNRNNAAYLASKQAENEISVPKNRWYNFQRALTLSLTNPKAILFFLSFFVQFVDPKYPNPMLSFFVLAVILQFLSFIYLNVLIFMGQRLARQFASSPVLATGSMILVGLLFIGFAVKLWTAVL